MDSRVTYGILYISVPDKFSIHKYLQSDSKVVTCSLFERVENLTEQHRADIYNHFPSKQRPEVQVYKCYVATLEHRVLLYRVSTVISNFIDLFPNANPLFIRTDTFRISSQYLSFDMEARKLVQLSKVT